MKKKKLEKFIAKVISGFRITIPPDYREQWQIEEGDRIDLAILGVQKKEAS